MQIKDFEIFTNYWLFYFQNLDNTILGGDLVMKICTQANHFFSRSAVWTQLWELDLSKFTVFRKSINSSYVLSISVEHAFFAVEICPLLSNDISVVSRVSILISLSGYLWGEFYVLLRQKELMSKNDQLMWDIIPWQSCIILWVQYQLFCNCLIGHLLV